MTEIEIIDIKIQYYQEKIDNLQKQKLKLQTKDRIVEWISSDKWINGWPRSENPPVETRLHKMCSSCGGTGVKEDGSKCIHMLSCFCDKCSVTC